MDATTNWNVCIICGIGTGDLKCPANSLQGNGLEVYNNFLVTVTEFRNHSQLFEYVRVNEKTTAQVLYSNKAKWHKACRLELSSSKLERLKKKTLTVSTSENVSLKRLNEDETVHRCKRLPNAEAVVNNNNCIFCLSTNDKENLYNCSTLKIDHEIRRMATVLEDYDLLIRISGGDLIAIEAKYHAHCYVTYRNRFRSLQREHNAKETSLTDSIITDSLEQMNCNSDLVRAHVFAELISYVDNELQGGKYLFKLKEIHGIYENRLHELGINQDVNRTRLKLSIIGYYNGLCHEKMVGKEVFIIFEDKLLTQIEQEDDIDEDMIGLGKTVNRIRREMFDQSISQFDGNFKNKCQEVSVPTSLKLLISLLLYGTNIKKNEPTETQICLTIAQLIMFHCKKVYSESSMPRCSVLREPPLPLYVALNVHISTRSKKLINCLHKLGLCVSYNRVLEVESCMAASICKRYQEDAIVCPPTLKKKLYTVGALDNIDHNSSSTTAQGSFHGTAISVFQFPTDNNCGEQLPPIYLQSFDDRNPTCVLPDEYSIVPSVICNTNKLGLVQSNIDNLNTLNDEHKTQLENAKEVEALWISKALYYIFNTMFEDADSKNYTSKMHVGITSC